MVLLKGPGRISNTKYMWFSLDLLQTSFSLEYYPVLRENKNWYSSIKSYVALCKGKNKSENGFLKKRAYRGQYIYDCF